MAKKGKYSKPGKGVPVVLLVVLLAVFLVSGGILLGTLLGGRQSAQPGQTVNAPFAPDLDENAGEWNGMPTTVPTEPQSIKIPGYPSINIQANSEEVALPLHNPEGNPCYFTFTLVLKETGEVLYQSKQVPPGQGITSVKLTKALAPGEYAAVIQVTTASLVDGSAMNGANMETVLIAK